MRKINLGCGRKILDGHENYDKYPIDDNVIFIDLNDHPLPFKDSSITVINCENVLEHLHCNIYDLMNEFVRILKPSGTVRIIVPLYMDIIDHIRPGFSYTYFNNLIRVSKKDKLNTPVFRLLKKRVRPHLLVIFLPYYWQHFLDAHVEWVLEKI